MNKKKFFIKTFGCRVNQLESEIIIDQFIRKSFNRVFDILKADFLIINSCSVTQTADIKCVNFINKSKLKNPNLKIILTGCFAQLTQEKIKNVDLIIGNSKKENLLDYLEKSGFFVEDIFKNKTFNEHKISDLSKTRASIKIQDGCNNRCSYCTICLARGFCRSDKIENIIGKINEFVSHGFKEIVLTGIHIGQWGSDFKPNLKLIDLLKQIEKTQIKRYRISSLNPLEIDDELLNFLSKSRKFCHHFHLSLQSLCNKTLKNMNRKYSVEDCMNVLSKINKLMPDAFVGADIIAGFPDETIEDFEITKNNLSNAMISQFHVFPYSKRPCTVAFKMKNQIYEVEKIKRAKILRKISEEKHTNFIKKNIGKVFEIIVEKNPDKSGLRKGITHNYLNVLFEANQNLAKTLQNVKIEKYEKGLMYGKII